MDSEGLQGHRPLLHSFLAQRGLKKGDLSKFIERSVQQEPFAQTVAAFQAPNANVPEGKIEEGIEDALRQVRAERWDPPKPTRSPPKRKR